MVFPQMKYYTIHICSCLIKSNFRTTLFCGVFFLLRFSSSCKNRYSYRTKVIAFYIVKVLLLSFLLSFLTHNEHNIKQ
jgi:hypothetical protein